MLLRRLISGSIVVALVLGAGVTAFAGRYVNRSGLDAGSFVWSPTVAPAGPVTIIVTPAEKSVHVYRGGEEIGIATIPGGGGSQSGIYLVMDQRMQEQGGRERPVLTWRGLEVLREGPPNEAFVGSLEGDFAKLLFAATHRGVAVIVSQVRSEPQLFTAPGPFIDPMETGSVNRVGRFATPELRSHSGQAEVPGAEARSSKGQTRSKEAVTSLTSVILSRADLSAYVMKDGRLVDRLPITVDEPTRPFGLHAAVLVSPGSEAREARWLAFGLDDDAGAPHVAGDEAAAAMRRVRFLDRGRTAALAGELRPGAVVVLMDGHGPSATEAPRFDVALLTSEPLPDRSTSTTAPAPTQAITGGEGVRTQQPAKQRSAVSAVDAAKSRSSARQKPARRRGPLDHRESWPHSMYWPY